jgi:hypothetical protein
MYSLLVKVLSVFLVASTTCGLPASPPGNTELVGQDRDLPREVSDLRKKGSCLVVSDEEVLQQEIEEEFEIANADNPIYADVFELRNRQSGYW